MKKRIIASALTVILCLSLLPYEVFANKQSPVGGLLDIAVIDHTNTGGVMRPIVRLKFTEPIRSDEVDGGAINGDDKTHSATHYQAHIYEYSKPGNLIKAPSDPRLLPEGDINRDEGLQIDKYAQDLKNGMLYKMSIIPYHQHDYPLVDGKETRWAPHTIPTDQHPFKYVLTDFDTQVEGQGDTLEVTWEDPGADLDYTIGYIQGNYEGKSIEQIKEGATVGNNIQYISSGDIRSNAKKDRDPQTKRDIYKYTIDSNIVTGQMYSVFVMSTTPFIDGSNAKILKNDTSPKVVTATTEIELEVFNVGKDKIRLQWSSQLSHTMGGSYELAETQIKEYAEGDESGRVIATLYGKEGANIGYYEYKEPKQSTYYQLIFIYKYKGQQLTPEPKTAKVLYVPGVLRTKPATPQIPKPIGPNPSATNDERGKFLLPNDILPDVPIEDFWRSDHTFHANMVTPPTFNFVWSTYQQDLSLLYDIWVTDDLGVSQSETAPIVEDLTFNNGQNPEGILRNRVSEEIVGFKHTIKEYYDSNMRKLPLVPNKVYYVKIVAKKQYGDQFESSLPATVTIMFDSDGEVFAPPVISKPPLRLEPDGIGTTSITIGWLESWYEILARYPENFPDEEKEKAEQWNAKVYTTGSAISFINREGMTEHILKTEQDVGVIKSIVGRPYYDENFIDRFVDLGKHVKYEYKFMTYEEILQDLEAYNATTTNKKTVEAYIEMLMRNETNPDEDYGWKGITPNNAQDEEYINWKQHTQTNLKPNTSYVFFVKPYTNDYDGTKLQAAMPTWLVVTTLPDGEMPEGKPTVPVLSLNGKGDSHISVEWEYNSGFDYEIRYSRLEDPDKATPWPFEIGTEIGDPNYVEHGGKAVVTINGLFPDTTYHVWIRAKQKKGQQISAWSNPVTTKTDLLGAPTSPTGLGVASYQSILEVGKDFKPVDSHHITVEWQRNAADKDLDNINQDGQRVQKEYRYVVEIADNPEFIDVQAVTVSKDTVGKKEGNAEVLSRSMVYFDGLIANRPYYVRAKTILIAHDKENNRELIMESDYTQFVRIITKPSEDEYDGGDKENEVIYPDKIEEKYDGTTWTYEILDTQRVINEIVTENQFRYVVTVQKYKGRYDPRYRVIRIPQPVISTLINRRMELEIRTNILNIQIPAGALEAYMIGSSSKDMVEFSFETLSESDLYGIGMGYEYSLLSTPEKMKITLKGQKGVTSLNKVDSLLKIKINMPHQFDYMYKNLSGYTYDSSSGIWKKGNHQFDKVNMQLGYTSGSIGTYVVYEKSSVPTYLPTMSQSMRNVLTKHDILGLGTKYTSNMQVKTPEYINIMLGLAEKRSTIIPDRGPTNEEEERARKSGIYVGNVASGLTQEAAISGMVRLYELTNGMAVRPQTNNSVGNITSVYRDNIRKAYTIGLINFINPNAPITYQELFDLIEQVIE